MSSQEFNLIYISIWAVEFSGNPYMAACFNFVFILAKCVKWLLFCFEKKNSVHLVVVCKGFWYWVEQYVNICEIKFKSIFLLFHSVIIVILTCSGDNMGLPRPPAFLDPSLSEDVILENGVNYASGGGGILNETGSYFVSC